MNRDERGGGPATVLVNGQRREVRTEPDTALLYVLRNHLGLKGTRFGCGLGLCGSCLVLVDGQPAYSCDLPLWAVAGQGDHHGRGAGRPGPAASGDAGAHRGPGRPVRLLPVRRDHRGRRPARAQPRSRRRGGPGGPGRQPVPVRRAQPHRPGRAGRRGRTAGRAAGRARPDGLRTPRPGHRAAALARGEPAARRLAAGAARRRRRGAAGQGGARAGRAHRAGADRRRGTRRRPRAGADDARGHRPEPRRGLHRGQPVHPALRRRAAAGLRRGQGRLPGRGRGPARRGRGQADRRRRRRSWRRTAGPPATGNSPTTGCSTGPPPAATRPSPLPAYRVVGTSVPRLDLPDKLTGRPRYAHDLAPDGLCYGRVVRPPARGATLADLDTTAARWPCRACSRWCGTAASSAWSPSARRSRCAPPTGCGPAPSGSAARRCLTTATCPPSWSRRPPRPPCWPSTAARLRPGQVGAVLEATYHRPYLAHASMGPSTATALASGQRQRPGAAPRLRVWSHTQGVYPLRAELARALGLAAGRHHGDPRGGRGLLRAQRRRRRRAGCRPARPGRTRAAGPGRLERADELGWAPFGAAAVVRIAAETDQAGDVLSWRHEIWGNGHSTRPGSTPVGRAARGRSPRGRRDIEAAAEPPMARGGGAGRNSVPGYAFPAYQVVNHRLLGDAAAHVRAALAGRVPQRVRGRVVHGRARRRGRPRPGRVPAVLPDRPAGPGRGRGGGPALRLGPLVAPAGSPPGTASGTPATRTPAPTAPWSPR